MFSLFKKKKKSTKRKRKSYTNQQMMNNQIEFMSWTQNFTKVIVSLTFFLFFVSNVTYMIFLALEFYFNKDLSYIDTFIMEMHNSFRDVIGGYLIKSATENVIKISGSYINTYMQSKAEVIRKQTLARAGIDYRSREEEERYERDYDEGDFEFDRGEDYDE